MSATASIAFFLIYKTSKSWEMFDHLSALQVHNSNRILL